MISRFSEETIINLLFQIQLLFGFYNVQRRSIRFLVCSADALIAHEVVILVMRFFRCSTAPGRSTARSTCRSRPRAGSRGCPAGSRRHHGIRRSRRRTCRRTDGGKYRSRRCACRSTLKTFLHHHASRNCLRSLLNDTGVIPKNDAICLLQITSINPG